MPINISTATLSPDGVHLVVVLTGGVSGVIGGDYILTGLYQSYVLSDIVAGAGTTWTFTVANGTVIEAAEVLLLNYRAASGHTVGLGNQVDIAVSNTSTVDNPPSAPTGFWAQHGNAQVVLTWAANIEPDRASYNIYRAATKGGVYSLVTNVDMLTYTNTGRTNGVTYWYKIMAVDAAAQESLASQRLGCTPNLPRILTEPGLRKVLLNDLLLGV